MCHPLPPVPSHTPQRGARILPMVRRRSPPTTRAWQPTGRGLCRRGPRSRGSGEGWRSLSAHGETGEHCRPPRLGGRQPRPSPAASSGSVGLGGGSGHKGTIQRRGQRPPALHVVLPWLLGGWLPGFAPRGGGEPPPGGPPQPPRCQPRGLWAC